MAQQTASRNGRARARQERKEHSAAQTFYQAAEKRFIRTLRIQNVRQAAAVFVLHFVLGFSNLPGGLCPFVAGAFTACLLHSFNAPAAFLGCMISTFLSFSSQNYLQWWQLSACAAIWLTIPFWRKEEGVLWGAMLACGIACALPAPLLGVQSLSQTMICLVNATVSVVMVPVFERCLLALSDTERTTGEDDALCVLLALGAVTIGLWSLGWPGRILCCAVCGMFIALCARVARPGSVLLSGAVLGGVLYASGARMPLPMFFSGAIFSALPSSKEGHRRAILFIPGVLVGVAMASVPQAEFFLFIPTLIGGFAALFARKSLLTYISRLCPDAFERPQGQSGAVSIRTAVTLRIWANQMRGMADVLPQLGNDWEETDGAQRLAQYLCEDCGRKEACWNDRFEITRRYMFKLLGAADAADTATVVEQARLLGCVNIEKLEQILIKMRCENTLRKEEEARCQERRALNAIQIQGMADVLSGLSERFYAEIIPDDLVYRRAQDELKRRELDAKILYAVRVKERKEIMMIRTGNATAEELKRVADIACGVPMQPSTYETLAHTEVLFEQAARLEVNFSAACQKKEGETVAGDGYIARPLSGGRYLLALSDGMGSGECAHRESQASLHLLWQCLCAGYTRSQALLAVNGILLSCAGTEMFATMDLCLIDLHTGEAAFEKLGACTSYVIRGGECRPICADTLPMGMLSKVEPRSVRMHLQEDDLLIMVSDGIADYYPDGETGLRRALGKLQSAQPRVVCDTILNRTLRMQGNAAADDMTVLCARIQTSQNMW